MMEFHVSRAARDQYAFDQSLFQFTGNAMIANIQGAREFAQKMNDLRDRSRFPDRIVRAGDVHAMGLIDELSHLVIKLYDEELRRRSGSEQRLFSRALDYASQKVSAQAVYQTLSRFNEDFPALDVYLGKITNANYLASNSVDALEEQLMLWIENANPAFRSFDELFDDTTLAERTQYERVIAALREFFEKQPTFGPDNQTLIDMLRAPAQAAPDSLEGQLQFVQERWAPHFGDAFDRFVPQLLISRDLMAEDKKGGPGFGGFGAAGALDGDPQSFVPSIDDLRTGNVMPGGQDITVVEYEAFTPDREWMPRLVMIAKNAYVWLDQLSRKYQRAITKLDQVPDEEFDQLARWGFTGVWLIGLWERGRASERIKQMMGAQDAVASAYSLYDYSIAEDLGGYLAMENLKGRAWQRGIRMASDMVPNHMAIDSKWVMERPDYFLSLDHSPYPSYSFNGPDLSSDDRVGIYVEDHYYDKSDAAVVFKRVDKWTGESRYIYHGNDGTSIPWNDTAQIDYLNADAREAVIQAILHVARQFPIVRFDAAMTLAKRQVRRLWFPEPGAGGAIPSRAGLGMSAEEFDALMPNEFWREVVDRAAVEIPDTLLLAEAFWMLEGYFVRTLGMHRVYNSAFMNMLRDEKNDEYRQLIKNTIEFDPEILRRYVNFLNNPDEKTAAEQFGKGDKYFGVTLLMLTMPGLPMFGHGQVEGYTEKYGMEFRYPKLWERPDDDLVSRHEREIFPIAKKRYLFAGVDQFRLFDFWDGSGGVNEDVFAYSNRFGDERALVIYHNKFATAEGWIRTSAAYVVKDASAAPVDSRPADADKTLTRNTLGESLGLANDDVHYTILKDHNTGLEYLHSSHTLHDDGLFVRLNAYQSLVFTEIHEVVSDAEHPYAEVAARLGGRGVPSIQREIELLKLAPVIDAYRALVNGETLKKAVNAVLRPFDEPRDRDVPGIPIRGLESNRTIGDEAGSKPREDGLGVEDVSHGEHTPLLDEVEVHATTLMAEIKRHLDSGANDVKVARAIRGDVEDVFDLVSDDPSTPSAGPAERRGLLPLKDRAQLATLFSWLLTRRMGDLVSFLDGETTTRQWLIDWSLSDALRDAFRAFGLSDDASWQRMMQVKLMLAHRDVLEATEVERETSNVKQKATTALATLFADPDAKALLQINHHDGATYFNKEQWESLMNALYVAATTNDIADDEKGIAAFAAEVTRQRETADALIAAAEQAAYQVEELIGADTKETVASEATTEK